MPLRSLRSAGRRAGHGKMLGQAEGPLYGLPWPDIGTMQVRAGTKETDIASFVHQNGITP